MIQKMLKYIPILAVAMLCSCSDFQPDSPEDTDSLTLVLNISDMKAKSRAEADTDNEPINTLRVIIARPDGTVEINRMLRPLGNTLGDEDLRFKISKDDYKTVALIANEAGTGKTFDTFTRIDPAILSNPESYPDHPINAIITQLPNATTSVPMTAMYKLSTTLDLATKVGAGKYEINYNLCLMRTVTKFTFNIKNARNIPVNISEIGVNLIKADKYFLFPRVASADGGSILHYMIAHGNDIKESGTGKQPVNDIGSDSNSAFSEHYRNFFTAACAGNAPYAFNSDVLTLQPESDTVELEYYYYESNLPEDTADEKPYVLYVDFDGNRYTNPLENLPTLPRNTHVVVNMQFVNNDKVLDIEVLPYYGVDLYPSFGKKEE